jgi:hypothetical protein
VDPPRAVLTLVYHWGPLALRILLPLAVLRHLVTLLRRIPRRGLTRFGVVLFWCVMPVAALIVVERMWPLVHGFTPIPYTLWDLWYALWRVREFADHTLAILYLVGLVLLFMATRALSRAAGQAAQDAAAVPPTGEGNSAHPITA